MKYLKVSEMADKWGVSPRRVRIFCEEGKIPGVIRKGKLYLIPQNAVKPADRRLSGSATLSNPNMKKSYLSNLRLLTEDKLVHRRKEVETENCCDSNEKLVSAGVVYFYLCGILEENSVMLNIVDSYRCLPDEFYNKVFSKIADSGDFEKCVHIFGVIGISKKIEMISYKIESGLKENCSRIINENDIIKEDDNLDRVGNLYFRMIQEFFLEGQARCPYKIVRNRDGWKLSCIWCGNSNDETLYTLADRTIEIWLENEAPEMLGKQLMLRSFFASDFVNRKLVACYPKNQKKEWQLLFEGGHSITLGTEKFYKGTAAPGDVGFFSVSGINGILMNPIYSHGIYLYPDDVCLEWHKAFLYLCATSDVEWDLNNFKLVYDEFLLFMQENICLCMEAPPLVSEEEGLKVFLIQIASVREFLRGEDETVISKDLFQTLNTRYVYFPYLTHLITDTKHQVDTISNEWLTEKIDVALKTTGMYEKGVLWENIAEYVLEHIPGWRVTGRRVRAGSQEIDLSIANISLDDALWQLGSYVLVECKNWKRRVDIPQVRNIAYISAMKGNKTALLFAANGITDDASKEIIRLASTGTYILVITAADMLNLNNNDDCRRMILKKFGEINDVNILPI